MYVYSLCLLGAGQLCPLTPPCRGPAPALPYCHCPAFVPVPVPGRGAPRLLGSWVGLGGSLDALGHSSNSELPCSPHTPVELLLRRVADTGAFPELGGRGVAIQSHLGGSDEKACEKE